MHWSADVQNVTAATATTTDFLALANEDTLLLMMFLGRGTQNECCVSTLRKLGNICCGHKMFLNKIRNIFVSRTRLP